MTARAKSPPASAYWVLVCAYCSAAGWVLSAVRALNAVGYGAALVLGAGLAWVACRKERKQFPYGARLRRRLRRGLPLGFFILSTLVFLGGILYPPSNWDALSYRVPRVLHWLAAGRWHWIHTMFERLNVRGCGYEWMMSPLIALTKSDRLLFLPNFISFCFLPGLFFSALTGIGVKRRAAWAWIWVLPSGYCFLLQAGSLGNDLFGAFCALAAFSYALRARHRQSAADFWVSALAMALSTGVKANNLLLVLVWAVAVVPCWRLIGRRVVLSVGLGALALLISLVPTAVFNFIHVHDWTGTKADGMSNQPGQHLARIYGNSAVVLLANLSPPVAPFAKTWNTRIAPKLATQTVNEAFGVTPGSQVLQMDELQVEEEAGLGLGVCALLVISVIACVKARPKVDATSPGGNLGNASRNPPISPRLSSLQLYVFVATAAAFAAFMAASFATRSEARLLNAYYDFLVLPFLIPQGHEWVVRRRWWCWSALAVMALAALPLVLSPARPLIPVQTVLGVFEQHDWAKSLVARAEKVYSVYRRRGNALAPLVTALPSDEKVIGMITWDDLETGLWKPFGRRRVVHVCPGDTPQQVRARGLRYIWVNPRQFGRFDPVHFDDWLQQFNAEVVQVVRLSLRGSDEPFEWKLVRLL